MPTALDQPKSFYDRGRPLVTGLFSGEEDERSSFYERGTPLDVPESNKGPMLDGPKMRLEPAEERPTTTASTIRNVIGGIHKLLQDNHILGKLIPRTRDQIAERKFIRGVPETTSDAEFFEAYPEEENVVVKAARGFTRTGIPTPKLDLQVVQKAGEVPVYLPGGIQTPTTPLFPKRVKSELATGEQIVRPPAEAAAVMAGSQRAIAHATDFFTSPMGVATFGLGGLPKGVQMMVAGGFAGYVADAVPEGWAEYRRRLDAGDLQGATEALVGSAIMATGAAVSVRHGMRAARDMMQEPGFHVLPPEPAPPPRPLPRSRQLPENEPIEVGGVFPAPARRPVSPDIREALPPARAPAAVPGAVGELPPRPLPPAPVPRQLPGPIPSGQQRVLDYLGTTEGQQLAMQIGRRFEPSMRYLGWDAEELASRAMARAIERGDQFNPQKGPVGAWLNRVMTNALRDEAQRRRVERGAVRLEAEPVAVSGDQPFSVTETLASQEPIPIEQAQVADLVDLIERARRDMGQREQDVLSLMLSASAEPFTLAKAARHLGISSPAAKTTVDAVRQKIGQIMEDAGFDLGEYIRLRRDLARATPPTEPQPPTPGERPSGIRIPLEEARKQRGEAGAVPLSILDDIISFGSNMVRFLGGKAVQFGQWSAAMIRALGTKVTPYLSRAWAKITGSQRPTGPGMVPFGRQGPAVPGGYVPPTGLGRELRRLFVTRGLLPESAFEAGRVRQRAIQEFDQRLNFLLRDFQLGAWKHYRFKRIPQHAFTAIRDFLEGDVAAYGRIPAEMQRPVSQMRGLIDALSRQIASNPGLVSGPMAQTILNRIGEYMNISYELFINPKRRLRKIEEADKNIARALIDRSLRAAGRTPDAADIEGVLNMLLEQGELAAENYIRTGTTGSKNLDILMHRKNVPDIFQKLYGKIRDPVAQALTTLQKQSRMLIDQAYLEQIREAGLREGWLFEGAPKGEFSRRIAAEGNANMSPLDGLYTHPDIANALKVIPIMQGQAAKYWKIFARANAVVKWGKTIGSAGGQVRNVMANPLLLIQNGNILPWRPHEAVKTGRQASKLIAADWGWSNDQQVRDGLLDLTRRGVLEDAEFGEMMDFLDQGYKDAVRHPYSGNIIPDSVFWGLVKAAKLPVRGANASWRAGDNWFKLYAFQMEFAKLQRAFPNRPVSDLKQEAAMVVRKTMPYYEDLPPILRGLRYWPFHGVFFSWPFLRVINTGRSIGRAFHEITTPGYEKIGWGRLIGNMIAMGLYTSFAYLGTKAALTDKKEFLDEDPEFGESKADSLRRILPDYQQSSEMIVVDYEPGKSVTFVDLGFTDPMKEFKQPIIAFGVGRREKGEVFDGLVEALKKAVEPYVNEGLLVAAISDIKRGVTREGFEVWRQSDDDLTRWEKSMQHLWRKAFEPGTITLMERISSAATGEPYGRTTSYGGRELDLASELSALIGFRTHKRNIPQRARSQMGHWRSRMNGVEDDFERLYTVEGTIKLKDLTERYERMIEQRHQVFRELRDLVKAYGNLGMSASAVKTVMKDAGISNQDISAVFRNQMSPYRPSQANQRRALQVAPERISHLRIISENQLLELGP